MSAGIYLPALERTVSVRSYCAAVRKAKANPTARFPHGLTTWWPTTGADIVAQFREEMHARISSKKPIKHA